MFRTRIPAPIAIVFGLCLLPTALLTEAHAQQSFAYPSQGQSPEQQALDTSECNNWAVTQTDFDPSRPSPQMQTSAMMAPPPPSRGGAITGAARGGDRRDRWRS